MIKLAQRMGAVLQNKTPHGIRDSKSIICEAPVMLISHSVLTCDVVVESGRLL